MDCNLNHCKFACMTIDEANRILIASLTELYGDREASAISSMVMESLTGMPKSMRIVHKTEAFTDKQSDLFQHYLQDLIKHRPVQYVLNEAWFGPYIFFVDENVLIPRPETEELVNWLLQDIANSYQGATVLDIGTGSGCIPVFLKKKRKDLNLIAIDISEQALEVAKKNSNSNDVSIQFMELDIRNNVIWSSIEPVDIIISNPPYIPEFQKARLEKHVRNFEPAAALFVPDEDPIQYYKIIGAFALQKLKKDGMIFLEIHHDYAAEIVSWYVQNGFTLELRKDFSGNDRMIKAKKI